MSSLDEIGDGVKCVEFSEVIKIDEGKVRQHVHKADLHVPGHSELLCRVLHGLLRIVELEQPVNQPARKAVAPAHAVQKTEFRSFTTVTIGPLVWRFCRYTSVFSDPVPNTTR
jgi:hypothetical protein